MVLGLNFAYLQRRSRAAAGSWLDPKGGTDAYVTDTFGTKAVLLCMNILEFE